MPRGKRLTLEGQLQMNVLSKLDGLITKSGLSYDEVKEMLSKE